MIQGRDQFGYYQVGQEKFYHKSTALMRARELNLHPTWHFNREAYEKLDWQSDRAADLSTVYQARARQLREKYDHISVSFSGGSDSWTMVKAFIDSRTHLDEIFVRWPVKGVKGKYTVSRNQRPENILSEWDLTIQPQLAMFQEQLPHTKITVYDWTDDFFQSEFNDDQWYLTQDALNPGVFLKQNCIGENELEALEKGRASCIVYGREKPQLCMHQGNIYCYFLDKLVNSRPYATYERGIELFYWTPDMPEITWSQARTMYRYVLARPELANLIDWTIPYSRPRKDIWDNLVRSVIYADYNAVPWFQATKPTTCIYNENDSWLFAHQDALWMQSWRNCADNLFRSIDPRWLEIKNNQLVGMKGFIDGWYLLGPAPENYLTKSMT